MPDYVVIPGMAHFAGTGPEGATCGDCNARTVLDGRCSVYRDLMKARGAKVPAGSAACRHYVPQKRRGKAGYDFGGAK